MYLPSNFVDSFIPDSQFLGPALVVFLLIIVLLGLQATKWKDQRANVLLCVIVLSLLLLIMVVDSKHRWKWIVGLLPALMVGYQAFFLWLYHPKEIDGNADGAEKRRRQDSPDSLLRAQYTINSHFGLKTLFIRYGFPALLLAIAGIVIMNLLIEPLRFFSLVKTTTENGALRLISDDNMTKILFGLKLGAVGAYIYVLLELGRRTFRHDITGGSAMWCLVTLVLGPTLAATVALLWRIEGPQAGGWWGSGVLLFFAGFAPRRVLAAIEKAAVELLKIGPQSGVLQSRLIPLNKIRGISPQIEERLSEEGITDVDALAAAEPARLLRNTSFDMRQILSWIDEAILIVTLPKHWEALEEEGITGAIDLAWHRLQLPADTAAPTGAPPIPETIHKLAERCKFADSAILVAAIRRLYEDRQVQYIWALYNNFTEYAGAALPQ